MKVNSTCFDYKEGWSQTLTKLAMYRIEFCATGLIDEWKYSVLLVLDRFQTDRFLSTDYDKSIVRGTFS